MSGSWGISLKGALFWHLISIWVIFRTIKGPGSGRYRTGGCTPVLRDFAKNGDFAHTGFEGGSPLPPLKHALGTRLAAECTPP